VLNAGPQLWSGAVERVAGAIAIRRQRPACSKGVAGTRNRPRESVLTRLTFGALKAFLRVTPERFPVRFARSTIRFRAKGGSVLPTTGGTSPRAA